MRRSVLIVSLILATQVDCALACSPAPGWTPPTPASAYAEAEVVIHAQVLAQQSDPPAQSTRAKIRTLKVLKGSFGGDSVETAAASLCGIDSFVTGQQYVFFFSRSGQWFVSNLLQPRGYTTEQLLQAIGQVR
ncbi:MAG: hypothetical protein ABI809_08880 [Caldimonas sp.]